MYVATLVPYWFLLLRVYHREIEDSDANKYWPDM